MLQKVLPEAVYQKVEDFITTVDVIEDISATKQEIEDNLKQERKNEFEEKNIKFGLDD